VRIVVTNDAGITCDAELNDGERRVTSMRLDDDDADRALVGLCVLSGCIAAVMEDVARNKLTLRQAADEYVRGENEDSSRRLLQGAGSPAMRPLRPEAPTCEGGCE
jgi:hypothetical protein